MSGAMHALIAMKLQISLVTSKTFLKDRKKWHESRCDLHKVKHKQISIGRYTVAFKSALGVPNKRK